MGKLTEKQAIRLLKKYAKNKESFDKVLAHSIAVQKVALELAKDIPDSNEDNIKIGSLLHDIGRFYCWEKNPEKHGIRGAEILRKENLPEYASIAERHLGAGISKEDILEQNIDLPLKDYIPVTKEEKIICHADNLIKEDKRISLKKAVERYEKELGKKVGKRVKRLARDVEKFKRLEKRTHYQ